MEQQPELNVELLKRVIKRIERDKNWDQEYWGIVDDQKTELALNLSVEDPKLTSGLMFYGLTDSMLSPESTCGTRFCVAGHTVLEAGDVMLLGRDNLQAAFCLTTDDEFRTIDKRAQELLGLTDEQADLLFAGSTGDCDFEQYKEIVTEVTGVTFE